MPSVWRQKGGWTKAQPDWPNWPNPNRSSLLILHYHTQARELRRNDTHKRWQDDYCILISSSLSIVPSRGSLPIVLDSNCSITSLFHRLDSTHTFLLIPPPLVVNFLSLAPLRVHAGSDDFDLQFRWHHWCSRMDENLRNHWRRTRGNEKWTQWRTTEGSRK